MSDDIVVFVFIIKYRNSNVVDEKQAKILASKGSTAQDLFDITCRDAKWNKGSLKIRRFLKYETEFEEFEDVEEDASKFLLEDGQKYTFILDIVENSDAIVEHIRQNFLYLMIIIGLILVLIFQQNSKDESLKRCQEQLSKLTRNHRP